MEENSDSACSVNNLIKQFEQILPKKNSTEQSSHSSVNNSRTSQSPINSLRTSHINTPTGSSRNSLNYSDNIVSREIKPPTTTVKYIDNRICNSLKNLNNKARNNNVNNTIMTDSDNNERYIDENCRQKKSLTCSTPLVDHNSQAFSSGFDKAPLTEYAHQQQNQLPVVLNLNHVEEKKHHHLYNDDSLGRRNSTTELDCRQDSANLSYSNSLSRNYSISIYNQDNASRWKRNSARGEFRLQDDLQELNMLIQNLSKQIFTLRQDYTNLLTKQRYTNRRVDRNYASLKSTYSTTLNSYSGMTTTIGGIGTGESMLSFSQFVSDKIITSSPSNSTID